AKIERSARMGRVAEIEEACLIVAANVTGGRGGNTGVFDFVLITCRDAEIFQQVAGLGVDAGAVIAVAATGVGEVAELCRGDRIRARRILRAERIRSLSIEALDGIGAELTVVGFCAHELVMPVFAGGEIPAGVGAEELIVGVGVGVGRLEQSLPRSLRVAGVVAEREAKLVVFSEAVAEVG